MPSQIIKCLLIRKKFLLARRITQGIIIETKLISMAYNPITLDYDKSIQGEILKNKDELYQVYIYLNFLM